MTRHLSSEKPTPQSESLLFERYVFDPVTLTLWRGLDLVQLQKLPARVLLHLLSRPGDVVLRRELCDHVWGGVRAGCDDRLNTSIAAIRIALGDSARSPRFLETVPRRGYRWLTPVDCGPPRSLVERRARNRVPRLLAAAAVLTLVTVGTVIGLARPMATAASPSPPRAGSSVPQAQELYLRATALARSGTLQDLREALELFERSSTLDPEFAGAFAGVASVASMIAFFRTEPPLMRTAYSAAGVVTKLAPGGPEASAASGMVSLYGERRFREAITSFEGALEQQPGDALVQLALADAYRRSGSWEESLLLYEEILASDPYRVDAIADLAFNLERGREWRRADEMYARGLAITPGRGGLAISRSVAQMRAGERPEQIVALLEHLHELGSVPPHYAALMSPELTRTVGAMTEWKSARLDRIQEGTRGLFQLNRGWLTSMKGDRDGATALYRDAVTRLQRHTQDPESWNGIPDHHAWLGMAHAALGERGPALAQVTEILERFPADRDAITSPNMRGLAAEILVTLGHHEAALDLIDELLARPSAITVARLRVDPVWAPLRGHPRYSQLVSARAPRSASRGPA